MNQIIVFLLLICLCIISCSRSKGTVDTETTSENSTLSTTNSSNRSPIEAQTPENANLETRVAELEKRLATMEAKQAKSGVPTSVAPQVQPGQPSGTSRDNGARFIGNWFSGTYYGGGYVRTLLISKDGDKYIIRGRGEGSPSVISCELSNGSLKCAGMYGNADFIESSGNLTFGGEEWKRIPAPAR